MIASSMSQILVDHAVVHERPRGRPSATIRHRMMKADPDHVHRGEHVALLEANLHVDAADLGTLLEVPSS